jgi:hypothetical protein
MSDLHKPLLSLVDAAQILHIDSVPPSILETERTMIISTAVKKIERIEDQEPSFMMEDSDEEEGDNIMYDSDEEDTPEDEPLGKGAITLTDLVGMVKKCNQDNKKLSEENKDLRKDFNGLKTLHSQALTVLEMKLDVVDCTQDLMMGVTHRLSNKVNDMDELLEEVDITQDHCLDKLYYLFGPTKVDRADCA